MFIGSVNILIQGVKKKKKKYYYCAFWVVTCVSKLLNFIIVSRLLKKNVIKTIHHCAFNRDHAHVCRE